MSLDIVPSEANWEFSTVSEDFPLQLQFKLPNNSIDIPKLAALITERFDSPQIDLDENRILIVRLVSEGDDPSTVALETVDQVLKLLPDGSTVQEVRIGIGAQVATLTRHTEH